MFKRLLGYVVSFAVIMACLLAGLTIQSALGTSIPGSIFGMLLLFALLVFGIVPVEWVKPTSQLFIRYMILLFVPISVGLMDHYEMLAENALPILASAVGGTAIVLVLLGLTLEHILKGEK
ncbi:CidA/LrgA family protein [Vibrio tapetis]|uniref:Uncharacterized protein n=1 Tax=Vibrio tapetis subsp. tapetis TaxID=1671868 RepID=A0A2N8ZA02_9VIBR|nr:CidA/LrgA family protein [Vibrio tapetis]SON48717.1 conserved hypothetical protein; putative inner membrane protein [Vibrio tapetis subsp. tapetis]